MYKLAKKGKNYSLEKDGINAGSYNLNPNELETIGIDLINKELEKANNKKEVDKLINSLKEESIGLGDLNFDEEEEEINNIELKTIADFKRLPVGTYLRRILTPRKNGLGLLAKIKRSNSVEHSLQFDEEGNKTSALPFPAASDCKIEGDQIIFYVPDTKTIELIYKIYPNEGLDFKDMNEKYKNDILFLDYSLDNVKGIRQFLNGLMFIQLQNDEVDILERKNGVLNKIGRMKGDLSGASISFLTGNKRFKRSMKFAECKDKTIIMTDDMYISFNEMKLVFDKKLNANLIQGDGKLYEIKEDINNIPEGKNYGPEALVEYKDPVDLSEGKTEEQEEQEIESAKKQRQIDNKETDGLGSEGFSYIPKEKSLEFIKSLKSFKPIPSEDKEIQRFSTDPDKTDIFILIAVGKFGYKDNSPIATNITLHKRKHIEVDKDKEKQLKDRFMIYSSQLKDMNEKGKEQDPQLQMEKLLEKELKNGRKAATISYKDGKIEKLRLFKGNNGFGYFPKGASRNGYRLDLGRIESIKF